MTEASSAFANFLLAQIRVASARARLFVNEVDTIGVALTGRLIDTDTAVAQMAELGVDVIAPATVIPSTPAT
jgi:hypothetical protein